MTTKKNLFFTQLLVLALVYFGTSCASTSKAPAEKSVKAKSFEAPAGNGTVFLYRSKRVWGSALQLPVKINSLDAGGTGPGTFFRWDLKPGTYTFSSATPESSAVVQLNIEEGQVYFIRQDASVGVVDFRTKLKEVDQSQGQTEVMNCKLLVSSYLPQ